MENNEKKYYMVIPIDYTLCFVFMFSVGLISLIVFDENKLTDYISSVFLIGISSILLLFSLFTNISKRVYIMINSDYILYNNLFNRKNIVKWDEVVSITTIPMGLINIRTNSSLKNKKLFYRSSLIIPIEFIKGIKNIKTFIDIIEKTRHV